jgi:cell division protein FtsB
MKKLFSLVIVFLMAFTLAACTNAETNTRIETLLEDINSLEAQIEALEDDSVIDQALITSLQADLSALEQELASEETANAALEDEIEALQAQIDALLASMYDGVVTFSLDVEGTIITRSVGYKESNDLTAFDLLTEAYEVDFTESEWGKFITGIEDLTTKYGNYISISKNGESLLVGLEDASYTDQDAFYFEVLWWDQTAEMVDSAIHAFLDNQVDQYIGETQNYYVMLALKHLGVIDTYTITLNELGETPTANDYIKQIFIAIALGLNIDDLTTALNGIRSIAHPYPTSLQVMALNQNDSLDLSGFITDYITDLESRTLNETDLDTLSLMLLALTMIDQEEALQDAIIQAIEATLYTSAYGNNSATFAHVVMALLSQGINPTDAAYNVDTETTFIDAFLSFYAEDGSFYYLEDSIDPDLNFSTPQAFLALVLYDRYLNEGVAIHPFITE